MEKPFFFFVVGLTENLNIESHYYQREIRQCTEYKLVYRNFSMFVYFVREELKMVGGVPQGISNQIYVLFNYDDCWSLENTSRFYLKIFIR